MKNFSTYTKLHRLIAAAVVVLIIAAVILQGSFFAPLSSYAESSSYSDVLTDLQKDSSFNISDYPSSSTDYSLSVIQIAESEDGELFVYVYQPYTGSKYDLTATSINISKTIGDDNLSYKNYSLTLLSSSGTLHKYVVDDFTVSSSTVRYYDISSIYRTYYSAIDGAETSDNTISELAIAVAQRWAVGEINGETYYDMEETQVVTITAYAGFIRYWSGLDYSFVSIDDDYVDSHFVAFSCDYDIDELYEADISFYTVPVTYKFLVSTGTMTYSESTTYGDIDSTYYEEPLTIEQGDIVSYENIGYFGLFSKVTYSWDRICTVADFLDNIESNEECEYDSDFINTVSNYQWVLRFYETKFTKEQSTLSAGSYTIEYTEVTDITILRLKFLSDGTVYNIGVVSNKITGSTDPDVSVGHNDSSDSLKDLIKKILSIVALVLLCVLFAPIIPYVAKLVVWIISLPFKLINAIVQAVKKRSDKPKKE